MADSEPKDTELTPSSGGSQGKEGQQRDDTSVGTQGKEEKQRDDTSVGTGGDVEVIIVKDASSPSKDEETAEGSAKNPSLDGSRSVVTVHSRSVSRAASRQATPQSGPT